MTKDNQPIKFFRDGSSYDNAYFIKVDASGHSNIVRKNPADRVDKLFDLVEKHVYSSVEDYRNSEDCEYAEFWGWQGDGGLCVIYDKQESKALKTAIHSSQNIVGPNLNSLRDHLQHLGLNGELHLRVAIHKGNFRYKGDDKLGSIHSKDLNFVAHLEGVSPVDSVTISEDVYNCSPRDISQNFIRLPFPFEGKAVYCHKPTMASTSILEWIGNVPIERATKLSVYCERPSEENKALIVAQAQHQVIDLGTALNTCSEYLISNRRPDHYHQEVIKLLARGVNYTCLMLDPDSEMVKLYGDLRREDLQTKIQTSLGRLQTFAASRKNGSGIFSVFGYSTLPYLATLGIDRKSDGLLLISSYLPNSAEFGVGRADTPHLLITRAQDSRVYSLMDSCIDYYLKDARRLI